MDLKVLFQDNHLIIVFKPAGLLTQPTALCSDSIETRLIAHLQKEKQKQSVFLKPLHRIDKDVSGLVMFALSSKAAARMNEEMKGHHIKKTYIAEVEGIIEEEAFELRHYLVKKEHKAEVFLKEKEGAKLAILSARVLKRREHSTLLEIDLKTGRYHQIRAQLAKFGHAIIGDTKYGSKKLLNRICLHHSKLEFIHPVTQKPIIVEASFG
jgi:23S rRNA pseudouridine1911/1915/1917 synthase